MTFLPHTNTVILLERYCGTITEPGLPVHIPIWPRAMVLDMAYNPPTPREC